jgi:oligosaccharide repeat unit polymerase
MTIIFILFVGVISVLLGRWMFGTWFNHVSIYSGIWSFSLFLFELRFIHYYPLELETWLLIYGAWFAFIIGSTTIVVARNVLEHSPRTIPNPSRIPILIPFENEETILNKLLWTLNIITLLVALQHWYVVIHKFGSIINVFIWANILRTAFVHDELPGMIPYGAPLALSACLIAGLYTASIGRLKIVAVISLIVVILLDIAVMGRGRMILGGILFLSGYLLSKKRRISVLHRPKSGKIWRIMTILLAIVLFIIGAEVVRSYRGVTENLKGTTKSLQKLKGNVFITPSIYMYFTISNGVFNQYLKKPEVQTMWGRYSLAPFWRAMSKIGFKTYVPPYPPFYPTPVLANTYTYLGELYSDYGLTGVLIIPYILGGLASFYWFRIERRRKLIDIMVLGHINVVIIMSFAVLATSGGYWLVSLCFGLVIAFFLDRRFIIKQDAVELSDQMATLTE